MRSVLYYEFPDGSRIGADIGTPLSLPQAVRWLQTVIAESADPDPTRGTWYCEVGR